MNLLSVGCSLSQQSFNFFVKRAGSHSVPFPTWASREVLVQDSRNYRFTHCLLIIIAMNENNCRTMELELVKSCDGPGFLVYFSVLPNGKKFVAWNHWHQPHPGPGGKVRQSKLLRMIKWCKMAKPCCNLMEIDLSVGFLMSQQQKVWQGGPKPCHCSNQRGGIFKCRAQLGSCWDGLRLSFLNFKRI